MLLIIHSLAPASQGPSSTQHFFFHLEIIIAKTKNLSFEVLPSVLPPVSATYRLHYPRSSSFTGNWFLIFFLFSLKQQLRATYFNSQKQHMYTNDTIENRWLNNSFFEIVISHFSLPPSVGLKVMSLYVLHQWTGKQF